MEEGADDLLELVAVVRETDAGEALVDLLLGQLLLC